MAPHGQPAFVLYVQTAGFLVTCNPHIHALVADGVFLPSGTFQVLPPLSEDALCQALGRKLLDCLCTEGVLDRGLAVRMRQWRHAGFSATAPCVALPPASMQSSVHYRIRTQTADAEGRQRLARYMIRCPFALAKMSYDRNSGMVIYRSKMHATRSRNYQLMPALKWLRLLLNHVPDKYEHSGSAITAITPTVPGASDGWPDRTTTRRHPSSLMSRRRILDVKPAGHG